MDRNADILDSNQRFAQTHFFRHSRRHRRRKAPTKTKRESSAARLVPRQRSVPMPWYRGPRATWVPRATVEALRPSSGALPRALRVSQFEVNVYGPTFFAQAALPALKANRGAIVNVSSTAGHKPSPGGAHYAATKAALESLTRSWALELAPYGVRVNCIAPGPTDTPFRQGRAVQRGGGGHEACLRQAGAARTNGEPRRGRRVVCSRVSREPPRGGRSALGGRGERPGPGFVTVTRYVGARRNAGRARSSQTPRASMSPADVASARDAAAMTRGIAPRSGRLA